MISPLLVAVALLAVVSPALGHTLRLLEEDAYLSITELITKYGYPVEEHRVTTEDGYILTVFRIPYGKNSATKTANPRPVFVQHGLLSSSDDWILTRPEHALGYILADAGYDVWLGNARGNKWSRQHVSINPNKKEFWDISWHEMGVYDLPAVIDHILATSGAKKLHYIGHSMGTTIFFAMASMRPEYNDKIAAASMFAPVAFMANTKTPFFKSLSSINHSLDVLRKLLGFNEFMPNNKVYSMMGETFCRDHVPTQLLCTNGLFLICGYDSELLNTTMLPLIASHDPSGTPTKNLIHYAQNIKSGKFQLWDYGKIKNLVVYGTSKPPSYDLSKITAPVSLHYGENDILAVPEDEKKLEDKLPNLIGNFRVDFDKFNHLDFLFATKAKELVYDFLISIMDRY